MITAEDPLPVLVVVLDVPTVLSVVAAGVVLASTPETVDSSTD